MTERPTDPQTIVPIDAAGTPPSPEPPSTAEPVGEPDDAPDDEIDAKPARPARPTWPESVQTAKLVLEPWTPATPVPPWARKIDRLEPLTPRVREPRVKKPRAPRRPPLSRRNPPVPKAPRSFATPVVLLLPDYASLPRQDETDPGQAVAALRARVAWSLGWSEPLVDRVCARLWEERSVFLLGPRGCDQELLARAIHAASSRRERPFVALQPADLRDLELQHLALQDGTAYVELHGDRPDTVRFARALARLATTVPGVRWVIASDRFKRCQRIVPQLACADAFAVAPLYARPDDALPMIEYEMVTRYRQTLAHLTPAQQHGLANHPWGTDLGDLRVAAERIAAHLHHPRVEDAAQSLRVPITRQGFVAYLRRVFGDEALPAER